MNKFKSLCLTASIATLLSMSSSNASPWANPGDSSLRSDVELLAHHGLISGPVNNWPMSWKQITHDFYKADSMTLPTYVSRALNRVRNKIPGKINVKAKTYYTNKVQFFRGFEDEARSKAEIEGVVEVNLDSTSLHIEGRYNDNEDFNLDGSYISQELGNWSAYAGAVDRWWGPGQETTTLLSTNARPMPSIGIRRVTSKPFKTKWLSWIGYWDAEVFISKMEKERIVPSPIFVGMRLNFEPIKNFEVGFARTLMLCGEGRVCNFKSWTNGLIAIGDLDNASSPEQSAAQPGNQLAMINLSYSLSLGNNNVKVYAEGTAEDVIVFLPYTYTRLLGATFNGPIGDNGDQYRITAEASDSTGSLAWFYGHHRENLMYSHGIYKTGYRYYNKIIGSAVDSDSVYFSLKTSLIKMTGWVYSLQYQNVLINKDSNKVNQLSPVRERINRLNLNVVAQTDFGEIKLDGIIMDNYIETPDENKINLSLGVSWGIHF
ncbi:capsule assembly Wzi family protein [Emcibacteraceae bacterium]|nr:capsule assembly Wzi family protein [Emcibacteraceae bacterium]